MNDFNTIASRDVNTLGLRPVANIQVLGIVQTTFLASFTHVHVLPNPRDFLSSGNTASGFYENSLHGHFIWKLIFFFT